MADTIVQILKEYSLKYRDSPIQYVKDNKGDFKPVTFKEFYDKTLVLASAFMALGVEKGTHVGVISENRGEWLLIDQALFALRAANVPSSLSNSPYLEDIDVTHFFNR